MQCGTAVIDITPAPNAALGGGAFGRAQGIQHPLTATLLLLADGERRAIVVSCDLIGFDNALADELRALLADTCACRPADVMLAATHTHCGPVTLSLGRWGTPDPAYLAHLRDRLTLAGRLAASSLRPVHLRCWTGRLPGLSRNRSSYPLPVDDHILCAALVDHRLQPMSLVVGYACHPVTMHGTGLITPDYPYHLRAGLAAELGRDLPIAFLNGACGNVNPVGFRFAPDGCRLWSERDANMALSERLGQELARACTQGLQRSRLIRSPGLLTVATTTTLPLAPYPRKRERQRQRTELEDRLAATDITDWERTELRVALDWLEHAAGHRSRRTLAVPLQALAIGPLGLLAAPVELFSPQALALRDAHPDLPLGIATMANGYHGYVPVPEGFHRGVYEAVGVPRLLGRQAFAPDCGEQLVTAADGLLDTLTEGMTAPSEGTAADGR